MSNKRIRGQNLELFLSHGFFASDFLKPVYYHRTHEQRDESLEPFKFLDVDTDKHNQYPGREFVVYQVDGGKYYLTFIDRSEISKGTFCMPFAHEAELYDGEYTIKRYDFGHIKRWICDAFNIPIMNFDDYVEVKDYPPTSPQEGTRLGKYYGFETKDNIFGFGATINYDYPYRSWISGSGKAREGGGWDMPDGNFCEETVQKFAKAYFRDGFGYYGILLDEGQKDRIGKKWKDKIKAWEEQGWDCNSCKTRNYINATHCRICATDKGEL